MKYGKSRGSYLPVLMSLVRKTDGPILELGVGFCSTPFLHWQCYPSRRRLVSYENNPDYFSFARSWEDSFHEIHCLEDMDEADFHEPWTIVFVDHCPAARRSQDIMRLLHADYIVAHDTEQRNRRKYRFSSIYPHFKYKWDYTEAYPNTTILSNKHDISGFVL